jgi:uncharacterized protein
MHVLPPDVDPLTATGLMALSFVTSLITATFSLGGGSLMIAAMALVLPPAVVVPVHGCVQLGSNIGRAWVQRAHIQWRYLLWISLGALVGSVVGGRLAFSLPAQWFTLAIGAFVLVTTWLPTPRVLTQSRAVQFVGGSVVSAVGMVVGAAGPLLAAFVRGIADRRELVATHAMLNSLQHAIKIVVFAALGFAFRDYIAMVLLMVGTGFVGTSVGSRLLTRVPERVFRLTFRLLLSAIALGLIHEALIGQHLAATVQARR